MMKEIAAVVGAALLAALSLGATINGNFVINFGGGSCPYGNALPDGCSGAQANGIIIDANLATPKAVIDLNIVSGSGYINGTYIWTSSGGGCSSNATGTITVTAGGLGQTGGAFSGANGAPGGYTISSPGAGCTSRPTIAIPAGAGSGSGGSITATVYQLTPHNAAGTLGSNWNVAGVDYPVGYDTTLSLQNPATQAPSCASYNSGSKTLTITSAPCTINGFDFTSPNNVRLVVEGGLGGTVTITNNKFQCTSQSQTDGLIYLESGSMTANIEYNTFEGGAGLGTPCISGGQDAAIGISSTTGTITIEYNYCYYEDSKCVESFGSGSSSTFTLIEEYNFWTDYGGCGSSAGCSHGEAEYAYWGGSGQTINWTQEFNVMLLHFFLTPTSNNTAAEAIEADGTTINDPTVEYNYALARGNQLYTGNNNNNAQSGTAALYCGSQESGSYSGTATMIDNLVDYSGAFYNTNATSSGSPPCTSTFTPTNYNAGTGNSCNFSTCN